jgi:hypothetical protein
MSSRARPLDCLLQGAEQRRKSLPNRGHRGPDVQCVRGRQGAGRGRRLAPSAARRRRGDAGDAWSRDREPARSCGRRHAVPGGARHLQVSQLPAPRVPSISELSAVYPAGPRRVAGEVARHREFPFYRRGN